MNIKKRRFFLLFACLIQAVFCHSQDFQLKELILKCPVIEDTTKLIDNLKTTFKLKYHKAPTLKERVNTFKRVKIKGSDDEYIFIEYDHRDGPSSLYPFKYQIIFSSTGEPVKALSMMRYEFLKMEEDENPYLLTVASTGRGNGSHSLFRIVNGELVNVYEGFQNYFPRTYDAHDDSIVNEPAELNMSVEDMNGDGYNDLRFYGQIVRIAKDKTQVEYIFLFDPDSERFREKENYSEKYKYLKEY